MLLLRMMLRAARLEPGLYREVMADISATSQAILVVILMVLGTVLGTLRPNIVVDLLAFLVIMVGLWLLWTWLAYLLGTTLFRTPATNAGWGRMFRASGFAQAPGALRVVLVVPLTIYPPLGQVMFLAITAWQLAAMVVAVRETMGYESTARAAAVVLGAIAPFVVIVVGLT